jgi:hypothetical protein
VFGADLIMYVERESWGTKEVGSFNVVFTLAPTTLIFWMDICSPKTKSKSKMDVQVLKT